ncbi:hypothetical protein Ancab_027484 [Ancistrocladus abbreviatus]
MSKFIFSFRMLRDFKFLRRNCAKDQADEEIENVSINPNDPLPTQTGYDASRAPLHAIPEPTHNLKLDAEQEVGIKSKVDRTPTKAKGKSSDTPLPLRTPDKQGNAILARNKFGWSSANGSRHEGRSDTANYLSQTSRNDGSLNMTPRVNRTTSGRSNSGYSEGTSTQTTPTKSVSKPPNPGFFPTISQHQGNASARAGSYSALSKGLPVNSGPVSVINAVEVPHFDLKEDPSFWMDHNVQVIIRVRPLNSMERSNQGYNRCVRQESAQSITWIGQPETRFTFDHVACESVDQEMLFRMAGLPMVENCLSGYNSCMFAYGQTGSGKTYTMLGEIEDLAFRPSPKRGMTPRIFEFLFARIRAEEESRRDEKLKYSCKCSFLEIYNEQITDLLAPSSTNLLLREDVRKGVYVENLSEFEVHAVGDILKLLAQGSSNRKVAATNMNRESSRSHSVFTCVIESKWERDSTTNLRFARLNLVDLAGSERQKTSGAEGERLKEAANINKSLSTLGHVIMVLVDVVHGKPRHVPYRDSRLTFLLQDSLGGNSKTMIIANISPSICCAAETLNTLKFAQRAKLIQNNAVVNEDSSSNVTALQHQIRLLKEELSALRRQNVSRSLSFGPVFLKHTTEQHDNVGTENKPEWDQSSSGDLLGLESKGTLRVASKQLKPLEAMLAGALRREQMAQMSIKQLENEIEQLNRLVHQREEDTRSTKMMLKFREDKIQRMESLLGSLKPVDAYLLEESTALSEEIQLLQAKVDRNPEVTRFALENIRLLDQLRKFQDFYEEGEREILLDEVSEMRDQIIYSQLIQFIDGNTKHQNHVNLHVPPQEVTNSSKANDTLRSELDNELAECRSKLKSCLEINVKLCREIDDLHAVINNMKPALNAQDSSVEMMEVESIVEVVTPVATRTQCDAEKERHGSRHNNIIKHTDEVVNFELQLVILKTILKEERLSHMEMMEETLCLTGDLKLGEESALLFCKQCEDVQAELREAKCIIEALESQQLLSINEMEDLRKENRCYTELLHTQEIEICHLKEQIFSQESNNFSISMNSECEDSPLQAKVNKMQASLDMAKRLNMWYQSDNALQMSNQEEMDEVRRQAEAATAEAIVCLQEELSSFQQQVQDSELKEKETQNRLMIMEAELRELHDTLNVMKHDNGALREELREKEREMKLLSEDWELLSREIEEAVLDGHDALMDASDQMNFISSSLVREKKQISEQVGRLIKQFSEKELLIEELKGCLEDAHSKKKDMECMLRSLKGAALVITESHQQECNEKDREIQRLVSDLNAKISTIKELESRIRWSKDEMKRISTCATVAFVMVNRLSEINCSHLDALRCMDIQLRETVGMNRMKDIALSDQTASINEAGKHIQVLKDELEVSEYNCRRLEQQLVQQEQCISSMQQRAEEKDYYDILITKEKLTEVKTGVAIVKSCMKECMDHIESHDKSNESEVSSPVSMFSRELTGVEENVDPQKFNSHSAVQLKNNTFESIYREDNLVSESARDLKMPQPIERYEISSGKDVTIVLLRREIESAVESLKCVQAEMSYLRDEKEKIFMSEKQGHQNMEAFKDQLLTLQEAFIDFEKQCGFKILNLNHKLQKVDKSAQEAASCWCHTKELLDSELDDTKIIAAQKMAEASCLLSKFEEAQDTVKEADILINGLMIANEKLKLEKEDLKSTVNMLTRERVNLISQIQMLGSSGELRNQQYEQLEKQYHLDLETSRNLIQELESLIPLMQLALEEGFLSIIHDFKCVKSQVQKATKIVRSCLEEVWSEIILKDCVMSVLHLCHMGILLEAVNGLNVENGLLHHGLSESNSIICNLREHNLKSREELEICRMLKAKLLSDIKKSFDRISSKEDEAGVLSLKLSAFEEKILDLQLQEELMFERSNYMGTELAFLMNELDQSNSNALASILEQEELLKDNEKVLESQAENFMVELAAKDLELLILASELQELSAEKADAESRQSACWAVLEDLKKELVIAAVFSDLRELLLLDEKTKLTSLQKEVDEANMLLNQHKLVEEQNESLKGKLEELKRENCMLLKDLHDKESELKLFADCRDMVKAQNCEFQENICNLESRVALLQEDLELKNADINDLQCLQSSNIEELRKRIKDLESSVVQVNLLQEENLSLKGELRSLGESKVQALCTSTSNYVKCVSLMEAADMQCHRMFILLNEKIIALLDQMSGDTSQNMETVKKLMEEMELLDCTADEILSENLSLQAELLRKDDVLKGLLFDLSLLQESSASTKDQKDEIENLLASLESKDEELAQRSNELNKAVTHGEVLETELKSKMDMMSSLEVDLSKTVESLKMLSNENVELRSYCDKIVAEKSSLERELIEKSKVADSLEVELYKIGKTLDQVSDLNETLKSNLNDVSSEKEQLQNQLLIMEEKLETAIALAEENEAIAAEAEQIADTRRIYMEEKEEEVKLLERSVQELDCTINTLEKKVDILKLEAERQRLQREELESELHSLKHQMQNVKNTDADIKRFGSSPSNKALFP